MKKFALSFEMRYQYAYNYQLRSPPMDTANEKPDFNLDTDVKYPSDYAGQKLFVQASDWQNNAMLGWMHFPLGLYACGYKEAADGLLFAIEHRKVSLDSVIYPLVFLYRQGLELQLKLILPLARRLANKPAKADHDHRLMPLWAELRTLLNELTPHPDDKELPALEEIIQQLDEVDPQSFAFRYPATKKGEVSLPNIRHINVRHLGEVMDSAFMLMDGIHGELGAMDQYEEHGEW
ncbi:hypothetical protein [Pseudomonas sp. NPDC089401]|uniref:hypothetical protein n=1 Tax=Pseudomonas sp. NPDC089401 TaxID=3364462 RepID=UPI003812B5F9